MERFCLGGSQDARVSVLQLAVLGPENVEGIAFCHRFLVSHQLHNSDQLQDGNDVFDPGVPV